MKKVYTSILLVLCTLVSYAQLDSIPVNQNKIIEVYDVVAVKREHIDGRGRTRQFTTEMKGEILNYDESTGLLTFKGKDGKTYSFKNTDYKYFEYNKEFISNNKQLVVLPRKDAGFEYSIGLSVGYFNIRHSFTPDNYYLNGFESSADIPICLKLTASRFLNKKSLIGLTADFALLMDDNNYFSMGARYKHLYNPNKNSAYYFPIELKFSRYQFSSQYQTNDTTFHDHLNWEYPSQSNSKVAANAMELNIGQGVSFALKNKKSISLELMMLKQFVLSQSIKNENVLSPKSEFGISGVKLAVLLNL